MALTVEDEAIVTAIANTEAVAEIGVLCSAILEKLEQAESPVMHNGEPLLRRSDITTIFQETLDELFSGGTS